MEPAVGIFLLHTPGNCTDTLNADSRGAEAQLVSQSVCATQLIHREGPSWPSPDSSADNPTPSSIIPLQV